MFTVTETKIHLAESDRRRRSAPELWGPHGLEEGKGKGYLASSRQYGDALLGVRHQEEEEEEVTELLTTYYFVCVIFKVHFLITFSTSFLPVLCFKLRISQYRQRVEFCTSPNWRTYVLLVRTHTHYKTFNLQHFIKS